MDIRMVNRAPMLLNEDGNYPKKLEPSPELLEAAKFVGKNADFLIIPSNTPHLFTTEVERVAEKPLLSIVEVVVDEIVRRKCRRVGVMAIGLILEKGLYQIPLEERGIKSVTLPKKLSDKLDEEGVYPLQEGAGVDEIGDVTSESIKYLREQKVDGIILGCTEIPILLGEAENDPDIINPSQLLAEASVKKSLGE